MILDDDPNTCGHGATLDELFRRAGVRHPHAVALIDPPNRENFTDGAPRRLTFAQTDRAISELAARLSRLGLATDTVVAIQLPNTVEAVITLLAVLRAGMIAAPLPLLWREQDIVSALSPIGAKAIVTAGRIGTHQHAVTAMQAAVELFPIRYVCAFGHDVPDGVVLLGDDTAIQADPAQQQPRLGPAAAHVAVINFEVTTTGIVSVARNHSELIAGGLMAFQEAGMTLDAPLLSTIAPGSFPSIALGVVAWLLAGGPLHLHHGFDPTNFAAQAGETAGGTLLLPGPVLPPLAEGGLCEAMNNIITVWRAPERLTLAPTWHGTATLTDVASFGELGLVAMRRNTDGTAAEIPSGVVTGPRQGANAVPVIETMHTSTGTLALHGRMVPHKTFPLGAEHGQAPHLALDDTGIVDTGYPCRREGHGLIVTGPPAGITAIGGYRFGARALEAAVATLVADATITALPDALTGERLVASAANTDAIQIALQTRGANPLIAGAFRARARSRAA